MNDFYYLSENQLKPLAIEDKPIGKGGQAVVYRIVFPIQLDNYCIKVYHTGCSSDLVERIHYMIANPPNVIDTPSFRICWPIGFVYDKLKNVVGFYMPMAFSDSRDLYILSYYAKGKSIADRFKKNPDWFGKYERNTAQGIMNRLKMMANISQAFYQIHKSGNYVVLDVKPQNILATSKGRISIVDTDSFQIANKEYILFPGAAATPEYCAPEFDEQYLQKKAVYCFQ